MCCPLVFEFSVGIGGFVIGLGQISFFFSYNDTLYSLELRRLFSPYRSFKLFHPVLNLVTYLLHYPLYIILLLNLFSDQITKSSVFNAKQLKFKIKRSSMTRTKKQDFPTPFYFGMRS